MKTKRREIVDSEEERLKSRVADLESMSTSQLEMLCVRALEASLRNSERSEVHEGAAGIIIRSTQLAIGMRKSYLESKREKILADIEDALEKMLSDMESEGEAKWAIDVANASAHWKDLGSFHTGVASNPEDAAEEMLLNEYVQTQVSI